MKKSRLVLLLLAGVTMAACTKTPSSGTVTPTETPTPTETTTVTPTDTATTTPSDTATTTPSDTESQTPVSETVTVERALEIAGELFVKDKIVDSESKYILTGKVIELTPNTKSIMLEQDGHSILVYGLTEEDFNKLHLEYDVTIEGFITSYYNTKEITKPVIQSFVAATYDVTIAASENGSVTSADTLTGLAWGTKVNLTATPATGYKLATLKVNGVEVVVTDNACEITVEQTTSVEATFISESQQVAAVIYECGFETAEGYTASTTYNNPTPISFGPAEKSWAITMGTAATTAALVDSQSIQCRAYKNNSTYGVVQSNWLIENATEFSFVATYTTTEAKITIEKSTDNSTWTGAQTFTLTTTQELYTYSISSEANGESVYLRISVSYDTAPTATSRVTLDSFVIKGYQSAE